jgi:hypothetical protein
MYEAPRTDSSTESRDSFLRLARSWILLPIVAWVLSIPFLGGGALFLPIVVMHAPLGIIGYFEKITVNPTPSQEPAIVLIHAGFWLLFFAGLILKRRLPLAGLWLIWLILVTALFMSISGCAGQLGPGLRNDGNWH